MTAATMSAERAAKVQARAEAEAAALAAEREAMRKDPLLWAKKHPDRVPLTTTPTLSGYTIRSTVDVVTAECVFGMNLFRDWFAGVTDLTGGRSGATQKVLRDARMTCLRELRREAVHVGANAVVGVDLDYSEISGGGKSMLFLVASGTAVVAIPAPEVVAALGYAEPAAAEVTS